MLVLRLALRAVRWRAVASATVFAVALVGILAATVGPVYLHAVNERVLDERLTQAQSNQRDVHVSRLTLIGPTDVRWESDVRALTDALAAKRWFAAPVFAESARIGFHVGAAGYAGRVAAIDGMCAHMRIISGRCVSDSAAAQTVISARTAASLHLAVGEVIAPTPSANPSPLRLRIVGIGQPIAPRGPFWAPWNFFNALDPVPSDAPPNIDAFLVSHRMLAARLPSVAQTLGANVMLVPARVHLDDLPALRRTIAHAQALAADRTAAENAANTPVGPTVNTDLPAVLDGMSKEMSLARALITVSTAQLAVLAVFVLYAAVAGTTAGQGPEVALAKLRGRRPGSVLVQGIVQPIVLVALATPVAAFLAWLIVVVLARPMLGARVEVTFPGWAVGIAVLAAGGGMVAAVIAARRIVVAPVGALLRRGADPGRPTLGLALADAAAVTLAIAGLVELEAGGELDAGRTNPLSALAPTLLAVAGAVIALRLLPLAGRAFVTLTRDSPRVAAFLAVRQLVRRPAGARSLVLVAIAVALASFAVVNWSAARSSRAQRALNEAGASTVLSVAPDDGVVDLRRAVDRADPSGHSMAVAYAQSDQGTPLIAVDTSRFAGVGAWVPTNAKQPLASVLHALAGQTQPSVVVSGSRLRFRVDLIRRPRQAVHLAADVVGTDHQLRLVDFGRLHTGAGTYDRAVPECAAGCRLTGVALSADTPDVTALLPGDRLAEIDAALSASAYAHGSWRSVAGFAEPARWRGDGASTARLTSTAGALSVGLRQTSLGGPWATLQSTDEPARLPALLASGTVGLYQGDTSTASSLGLDDDALPIDGVAQSVTVPQLDRFGAMVDLGLALKAMSAPAAVSTHFQVWSSPSAPGDLAARLAAQGVRVTGRVRAATYRSALDRSGPAFADGLFLLAAGAATVLAVGATALGGIVTARRRGYELAALRVAGVAPRVLRRAIAGEQAILLGIGLVVGVTAGVWGSLLALPSTPFFVDDTVGPPQQADVPWLLLGGLVIVLAVAFGLTSLVLARFVARQASADRLREAQQ